MIYYVVEIQLFENADSEPFQKWLQTHIEEMAALPPIEKAEWYKSLPLPEPGKVSGPGQEDLPENSIKFTVMYQMADFTALDQYLTHFAGQMRSEGLKHFQDKFSANRYVLKPIS